MLKTYVLEILIMTRALPLINMMCDISQFISMTYMQHHSSLA